MIVCMPAVPTPGPEPTPGTPTPTDAVIFRSAKAANSITYFVAGDICTFTCDEGYQLGGSENRTCGDDGTWDGTTTTCFVPPGT